MERIIVRRGRYLTFEQLRSKFGNDPNVEIIWDRRREERRSVAGELPHERRHAQRRAAPPIEWERLDYIFTVGPGGKLPAPQANRTRRSDDRRSG